MAQETNHGHDAMTYLMRSFFENKERPIKHKIIVKPIRSLIQELRNIEIVIMDDNKNLIEELENYTYNESTNQG
jgi:hypothetical protein